MKHLLLAGALLLAPVSIAGCATAPSQHVLEAKGTYAGWKALDEAAKALSAAANAHRLTGDNATRASALLGQATDLMLAADKAYRAGETGTSEANVSRATNLITDLMVILSKGH